MTIARIRNATLGALICSLALSASPALVVTADAPATDAFERTWARTDLPVVEGEIARTWIWGQAAFTGALNEPYAEAPEGRRTVQYFDKARMEDNSFRADGPPWDVTNGLLVVEMISGQVQVGNGEYLTRSSAEVTVAGDRDDPDGPTYATLASVLDVPASPVGSPIIQRIDRNGTVSEDSALADESVTVGRIDEITAHGIAEPFVTFMSNSGLVYEDGEYIEAQLFTPDIFATGRPITEAYWARVKVAGTYQDVLLQCFERRCLTYTPGNPEGWQVEAGNVGQHYYGWRYDFEQLALEDGAGRIVTALDGHVMVSDQSGTARITDVSNGMTFVDPGWAPDGSRIVATGRPGGFASVFDDTDLYVMNADGSGLEALTDQDAALWEPAWSPDGTRIAYTRVGQGAIPEIWILDLEAGTHTRVDEGQEASWSPDGTKLLYDQSSSVWVADLDAGSNPVHIHGVLPFEFITGTSWSPDGTRIAVTNSGNRAENISPQMTILTAAGDLIQSIEPLPGWSVRAPIWLSERLIAFGNAPYFIEAEPAVIQAGIYTLDIESGSTALVARSSVTDVGSVPGLSFDWLYELDDSAGSSASVDGD